MNIVNKLVELQAFNCHAHARIAIIEGRVAVNGKHIWPYHQNNLRNPDIILPKHIEHGTISVHDLNNGQTSHYEF